MTAAATDIATDRRAARAAARRHRERRGALIAAVSTVVVLGLLTLLITQSSGWPSVRETFFSWQAFKTSFPDILRGFWLDVKLFVSVEAVVLVAGLGIALCRITTTPALFPVRLLAVVFTDLLRGIPTILLVYLVGFGVPALQISGLPSDPIVLGGLALAMSYSAYVAEVYRSGIESVHPSQRVASLALGLSSVQALRFVILPQAVRRVAPPLLNDFIALQKDVALVSILGPLEAFRVAQIYAAENFNYTPLLGAALLYIAVTIPLARLVDRMQRGSRPPVSGVVR